MEIKLKNLPLPCMVNRLYRAILVRIGRRTITKSIVSAEGRRKKQALCQAILLQLRARPLIATPCILTVSFTPPDCRKRDVDGYLKQLQDCLQAAGVVTDDSLFVQVNAEMMPQSKRPGWCDVSITELHPHDMPIRKAK